MQPEQVAGQQGKYLARLFSENSIKPGADLQRAQPFRYKHAGSTAYVGRDRAVFDLPKFGPFTGGPWLASALYAS